MNEVKTILENLKQNLGEQVYNNHILPYTQFIHAAIVSQFKGKEVTEERKDVWEFMKECFGKEIMFHNSGTDFTNLEVSKMLEKYASLSSQFKPKEIEPLLKKHKKITEEKKLELILCKFHGHTKEQWENELVKDYPYYEIPHLVEFVWEQAILSLSIPLKEVTDSEIERQWLDCLNNPESEELPKAIKKYNFSQEMVNAVLKPIFTGSAKWMRSELESLSSQEAEKDLKDISDEHCLGLAKCIFPALNFEVKRYDAHIYYLDIIEKNHFNFGKRINIFWLGSEIKIYFDNEGVESIEKGGIDVYHAYQYLKSKNYRIPK